MIQELIFHYKLLKMLRIILNRISIRQLYQEISDLAEAPSHGLPINLYDPKSTGAESYRLLAEEVMEREE